MRKRTPAGGFTIDVFEQVDRMIEKTAKRTLRWMLEELNEKRRLGERPAPRRVEVRARPRGPRGLARCRAVAPVPRRPCRCSDGDPFGRAQRRAIFLAHLIERLAATRIDVESLTYLAAAIRTDVWIASVRPKIQHGQIKRFTAYGMNPARELDDCGAGRVAVYRRSLLYLVSRAFERPASSDATDVPLVGMARFANEPVNGTSLAGAVAALDDAPLVWSPSARPADRRSDSSSHDGFDDDNPTMTSVLLRILHSETVQPGNEYLPNLLQGTPAAAVAESAIEIADQPPEVITAEVAEVPDQGPERLVAAAGPQAVETRSAAQPGGADADRHGNRVIDTLIREGWDVDQPGQP